MIAVSHRNVQDTAPALLRVVNELRSRPGEGNPPRAFLLAELEDDADAAALAAAGDAPVDVVSRTLGLEPIVQLFGLVVIEPPADQRLQPIPQPLADLAVRNALDLDALDRVARVDVLHQVAVVADARDEKDHASLAVRASDGPHRGDHVGMLALDSRGQFTEALAVQRLAGQRFQLAAKTRTQAVARQARDVDGLDDGPLGGLGVLRVGRRRAQGEDEEEQ